MYMDMSGGTKREIMQSENNYSQRFVFLTESVKQTGKTPRILVHSCCAPCSVYVIELLHSVFDVTLFFYNPNIYPEQEYTTRRLEMHKLIANTEYRVKLLEGEYLQQDFYEIVHGLEMVKEGKERCEKCFLVRLFKTAETAKREGFEYFTTTLTVSPYKNVKLINSIGKEASKEYGIKWLPCDFKKNNGYMKSVELSKKYGLYRQNYCGCEFSLAERINSKESKAAVPG